MRLAFLGTPDFAIPTLAALLAGGHEIAAVYSQPPASRGRGRRLTPSPVHAFASARGLAVRTPVSLRPPEEIAVFAALRLDAAVVVAFGQILPPEILASPRLGAFNLHASLLPRWRGAAPIQRAIMAGDTLTGACVMRLTEGLDEGPVLARMETAIGPRDTAGTLMESLAADGARLMARALVDLEHGRAAETPQVAEGATYARKIKASEGRIRWERRAAEVDHRIRGLSPHPGAWFLAPTAAGPVRVKALLSELEMAEGPPGEVLDDNLLVACAEGAVRIVRAQREGRAAQEAAEFLRGFPLAPGARLS